MLKTGILNWPQYTQFQRGTQTMKKTLLFVAILFCSTVATAQETVAVKIDAATPTQHISPYIYGQFIEHLGRCINGGGIWAEMLEDRKFFHSVGANESPWKAIYECKIRMSKDKPFAGSHSPQSYTENDEQPRWLGVWQNKIAVRKEKKYPGYAWVKVSEGIEKVEVHFHWNPEKHEEHVAFQMPVKVGDYYKIEFQFEPTGDFDNAMIEIAAFGKGTFDVGCVSLMPCDNVQGMRADTLELLKRLDSPVYRWPGGNFVSGYDWKDGIGDRDKRPPRKNPAWKGVEPNDFGVDEFLTFCKILGTEPYIAVNTGNGDIENALAELQYVNGGSTTPMGQARAQNGHIEPYGVKWWGIGNEMYGDWQIGHMPVEKYVEKNNQFVDAFRKADPSVKVIAVGSVGKWDEAFLPGAAAHMDLISEHFYSGENKNNVAEHVRQIPNSIRHIADAHRKYRKDLEIFKDLENPVPIALDEWNYWYGDHVFGELGTRYFMKDGLGVAAGIHEFARQADMYFMANYAQTVNVIGCIKTSKTNAKMETTGLALELYRKHFGNFTLKTEGGRPKLDVQATLIADGIEFDQKVLSFNLGGWSTDYSVSNTEKPFGVKGLAVGIVNSSDRPQTLQLDVAGFDVKGKKITRFEIADPQNDPNGFNDPDKPYRIETIEKQIENFDGSETVKPYSITLLKFEI